MRKISDLKKLKRSVIVSGAMALVIFALLISISYAKFAETRTVYTSYSAASFNAVLLGDVELDDLQEETVNAFGDEIAQNEYTPGMKYDEDDERNTARVYPFSVSNGMSDGNASEIGIRYSVRIRTTHNLPLVFTLGQKIITTDPVTETEICQWFYYTAVQTGTVAPEKEGDPIRYEYRFYSSSEIQEHLADEDHEMTEASFSILGEALRLNMHKLILEWPIFDTAGNLIEKTIGTDENGDPIVVKANDAYWMNEVEHMEVLLACTSANELKDEDGQDVTMPDPESHETLYDIPIEERYGTGIVILSEDGDEIADRQYEYHYKIDYRAFYNEDDDPDATGGEFKFRITNGTALQNRQTQKFIYYHVRLMLPLNDYPGEENWYDQDAFDMQLERMDIEDIDDDGITDEFLPLTEAPDLIEYRLYDEQYGTYRVMTGPDDPRIPTVLEDEMRRYQLYIVLSYADTSLGGSFNAHAGTDGQAVFTLSNTLTKNDETVYTNDSFNLYRIVADETNEALQNAAFRNKMTLIVECVYSDDEEKHFNFDRTKALYNEENGGAVER